MNPYGEFIAKGIRGIGAAYLNVYAGAGSDWDRIEDLQKRLAGCANVDLQWLIGKCLDPIEGEELSIIGGPRCSRCGSGRVTGIEESAGLIEIPNASFTRFNSLTPTDQEQFIARLCREWKRPPRAGIF